MPYLSPSVKLKNWTLVIITGFPRRIRLAPLYNTLKTQSAILKDMYLFSSTVDVQRHQITLPSIFQSLLCKTRCFWSKYPSNLFITHHRRKLSVRRNAVSFSFGCLHNHFVNLINYNSLMITYKHMLNYSLVTSHNVPVIPNVMKESLARSA